MNFVIFMAGAVLMLVMGLRATKARRALITKGEKVEALVAGSQGNAAAGYVTTLVSAPVGLDYASNEAPLTGGADEEGDEGYRVRVLDAWAHSPNGTSFFVFSFKMFVLFTLFTTEF